MADKRGRRVLTTGQRSQAEELFQMTVALQGAYWDALFELEQALSIKINEARDLSDWNIDLLRRGAEDDVGPISWVDRA